MVRTADRSGEKFLETVSATRFLQCTPWYITVFVCACFSVIVLESNDEETLIGPPVTP